MGRYTHLTQPEREDIMVMRCDGWGRREADFYRLWEGQARLQWLLIVRIRPEWQHEARLLRHPRVSDLHGDLPPSV